MEGRADALTLRASVKRLYTHVCRHGATFVLLPVAAAAALQLESLYQDGKLGKLWALASQTDFTINLIPLFFATLTAVGVALLLRTRKARVFLVDFALALPPEDWKFPKSTFIPSSSANPKFTADDLDFQEKILYRSGLGDETYVPPWLQGPDVKGVPFCFDMEHSRIEFAVTCFAAVKELLDKTGVSARDVRVVIVNSSLFNPTPSLSASIINHFKMRSDTINYSLGGMGCSAGLIAVDLARQVLQLYPDSYAVVVSHENLTNNWYPGKDRSMLVPNCIFRCNGSALLMSNKPRDARRAKYELNHVVRTNMAGRDKAFRCVYQVEDEDGELGVRLGKDLTAVAAGALSRNMGELGPLVLPLSEKLAFAANLFGRKALGMAIKPYVPDFMLTLNHVCIHSGGRAVIDSMQEHLSLSDEMVEPSRAGLYRFGNVSSTSVWYILAYLESYKGVRRGERVWQLGFGSGFKCNSAVWTANRRVSDMHPCWEGFDADKMYVELAQLAKVTKKASASPSPSPVPPS